MADESPAELRKKRMDAIKRLPPEKRIEALKELEGELSKREEELKTEEAERKQEIETAREMAAKSEEELTMIKKLLPKQKAVSMEDLFAPEDVRREIETAQAVAEVAEAERKKPAKKQAPDRAKVEDVLEERLRGEQTRVLTEEQMRQYARDLASRPIAELYSRAKSIEQDLKQSLTSYDTREKAYELIKQHEQDLNLIGRAVHYKSDAAQKGDYVASKQVREQMGAVEFLISQHYQRN